MEKHSSVGDLKPTFANLYEVDGEIGKGAIWSVHQCRAKSSDKPYAVKILHKQAKWKRKKLVEIGRLVIIHHANLIKIKELFVTPTQVYLVLHFASGGELFQRLAIHDFSEYDVARCVKQVTAAIQCLHQYEVPHGNLKPENILCEADGSQLNVLVGDFAMDRVVDDRTVLLHNLWCAAGFIAPETLKGQSAMPADLWSIGVIAYVLLCGYEPFHSDIEAEKFKLILKGQFRFVAADWQDVGETAKDFIRCLLAVNPNCRPTASKVLQHGWLNGTARKHPTLQATPPRLKQLINARKLKMSTEVAQSVTAKDVAETFPRQLAPLEHLLHETPFDSPVSVVPTSDSDMLDVSKKADAKTHEAGLDFTHENVAIPTENDDVYDDTLIQLLAIAQMDTSSSNYSISHDDRIPLAGFVFGDPLPYSWHSDGSAFLGKKDIDDNTDSQTFLHYRLDFYTNSELLLTTEELQLQVEDIFPAVEPLFV